MVYIGPDLHFRQVHGKFLETISSKSVANFQEISGKYAHYTHTMHKRSTRDTQVSPITRVSLHVSVRDLPSSDLASSSANHSVVVTKHESSTNRISECADLLVAVHQLHKRKHALE